MNNPIVVFNPCGIEVSHLTLVVALRGHDHDEPLREFPNTREGHQAVLSFLERSARPVRVALESTDSTAWIWPWPCTKRGWR